MESRGAFVEDMEPMPPIVIVEKTDIKPEERHQILEIISNRLKSTDQQKGQLAQDIKEELDNTTGHLYWHCIIGTDFACFVTYTPGSFMRVTYGDTTVQVFRLG
ncbi:hypothetical protein SprV_0200718700 [Sparganum proliferum]